MKAEQILTEAINVVNGQRADDYGQAAVSFQRIAEGWRIIIKSAGGDISAAHVALMLDWMKTARLLHSMDHVDSWTDKAGYTGLGAQLACTATETGHTEPPRVGRTSPVCRSDLGLYAANIE